MLIELALEIVGPALLKFAAGEVASAVTTQIGRQTVRGLQKGAGGVAAIAREDEGNRPSLRVVEAVEVVSSTPGRLRVEVNGLRGQDVLAGRLVESLRSLDGVSDAVANTRTGRLLIRFDPRRQSAETLAAEVDRVRSRQLTRKGRSTRRRLAAVV